MSPEGDVLESVEIPNGAARLRDGGVTARLFEVELFGKLLVAVWDPRETDHYLLLQMNWKRPPGPVSPEEREPVLDALWKLAPLARGVSAIIEERKGYNVILRWEADPGRHLVRIFGSKLELSELGRTMQAPFTTIDEGPPPPIAEVRGEAAVWRHPEERPVSDEEWEALRPRLESTMPHHFYETPYAWKISAPPRG
jgi:hypothetical protein